MDSRTEVTASTAADQTFTGESEMAALMRATDWARTPLGPVESWSQSLRMMVRLLLASRFPQLLWWGPEFLQIYNDAYRPVLGAKHPQYLGRPVRECWSEIWDVLEPLINTPFSGGPATWSDDLFLELKRSGFTEESHFTIAYSPVPDEGAPNGIGGVLATVHEITQKVIGERRVELLRDLAARSAEAKSTEEACQIAAEALGRYPKDIPFALLYLTEPGASRAHLASVAGIAHGRPAWPSTVELDAEIRAAVPEWPFGDAMRTETMQVVDDLARRLDTVPPGPWSDPPNTAVVVPIRASIAHSLAGFLVAGVSARQRLDNAYAGFFELVSSQIAAAVANARAYETERQRAEALEALDRAKTAFFSNVSHEFRTPLTLMLGPLTDLLDTTDHSSALSPQARDDLLVARRNGQRLLKLVNTLLDFSRIEAGRIQASYIPTDLAGLTADLASSFRSLCEKAGLRLITDCPMLPEPVYVDRDMWEKIVLNLLSNAFKFTFEGSITVSLRAVPPLSPQGEGAGGEDPIPAESATDSSPFSSVSSVSSVLNPRSVELLVQDTGTGIPADEVDRVFERFHRVEGAPARTYEGSGIGLALVRELVQLHGGTITVASVLGEGTTFRVTMPLGTAHLPAERVGARASLASTAIGAATYIEEAERWLPDAVPPLSPQGAARGAASDVTGAERAESAAVGVGGEVLAPAPSTTTTTPIPAQSATDSLSISPSSVSSVVNPPPLSSVSSVLNPRSPGSGGADLARIVVADDNADMRDYLVRLLGEWYQVEAVANGARALDAIAREAPDLVLADVMMPEMDGFALLRHIRGNPRTASLPIMLLSARAGEEATLEGLSRGADDYLVKPFSARELLARVSARLEIARLRREATNRLRELETTFETITDAVFVYNHEGRIARTNPAARALFGLDAHPTYEKGAPDERAALIHASDEHGQLISPDESGLARLLRGETFTGADALDVRLRLAGGRELQVNISGAPLRDETGAITGAIAISRDVTERRQIEQRTHEVLDALLAMATAIVSVPVDAGNTGNTGNTENTEAGQREIVVRRVLALVQGIFAGQYVGAALLDLENDSTDPLAVVGLTPEISALWWRDMLANPLSAYLPPPLLDRLRAQEVIELDLSGQPPVAGSDYLGMRRVLTVAQHLAENQFCAMTVEVRNRAAFTPQERDLAWAAVRLVALAVERERLAHERAQAQARALAATEARRRMDEFLGIASHELRTPLTSIMANVQMSAKGAETLHEQALPASLAGQMERQQLLLERTERQLKRLDRLVGDLLDVSRISAGKLDLRLEPCDLAAVVREAVEAQRAASPERRIILTVRGHDPIPLQADADRIGQVVTNYLANALKYSDDGAPVEVSVRRHNGAVRVAVRDAGPGLSTEQQALLFERFSRVPGIEQQSGSGVGLGLGLYICKTIVERHGGAVGVESASGDGSTFWFVLPLKSR